MSDGEWQTAGGASGNRPEPSFEDPEGDFFHRIFELQLKIRICRRYL